MVIASHFIEVVTLLCTKWSQEWFPLVLQVKLEKVEKHTKTYQTLHITVGDHKTESKSHPCIFHIKLLFSFLLTKHRKHTKSYREES